MSKIICVHGAPCSGKTTYVEKHAGAEDIIWDFDKVRTSITNTSFHSRSTDAQVATIMRMRTSWASGLSENKAPNAWFICMNVTDAVKNLLGEDAEYIHMDVSKDECLARLDKDANREDKEYMKELIEKYFSEERKAMKHEREYRNMELRALTGDNENDYIVEGYASTFEPYVLFTSEDNIDYSERIMPNAFDGADFSDVVFRVDHEGPVYARTSAKTLEVTVDEHGLAQRADLGKTQRGRDLYEDIAAGNYPKMSFAFTVAEDHYDKATHTRIIDRIAKVFDVSPVSFPANPTTELSVSTRDYFNGVIEAEKAERLLEEKRELQKKKIKLLLEV